MLGKMLTIALRVAALGTFILIAACTKGELATVGGACQIFTDPGFVVLGKTRKDQQWISGTQETGIHVCNWKRPKAK